MAKVAYKQLSTDVEVNALINNGLKYMPIWAPVYGTTKITYSFSDTKMDLSAYGTLAGKVNAWSANDQAAIRSALGEWSKYANIEFVEVSNAGAGGDIRITKADLAYGIGGLTAAPGTQAISGDILINTATDVKSGEGYSIMVHEIGHALGLQHPFANGSTATKQDTIMAYNYDGFDYNPTGLMSDDIKAIQYLYGAKDTSKGDDVYKFVKDGYEAFTIHDTGGFDTIDVSTFAKSPLIDLREGAVIGAGIKAMVIDKGTIIEKAIGTAGIDTFIGNAANNTFDGGVGIDTVQYEGKKSEYTITKLANGFTVTHGTDVDTLISIENLKFSDSMIDLAKYVPPVVTAPAAPVVTIPIATTPTTLSVITPVTPAAVDKVVAPVVSQPVTSVVNTVTTDTSKVVDTPVVAKEISGYFTGSTKVTIAGTNANDLLKSYNNKADVMDGGKGNDWLYGSYGNDTLILSPGKDYLFGGADADNFLFRGAFRETTIKDFDPYFGDKLVFDTNYFTALKGGITKENVKVSYHEGVQADTAEQHLILATWSGQLYYDADGNGAGKAEVIAIIGSGYSNVTFHDFLIM